MRIHVHKTPHPCYFCSVDAKSAFQASKDALKLRSYVCSQSECCSVLSISIEHTMGIHGAEGALHDATHSPNCGRPDVLSLYQAF
jgi:hypothetical protein